MWHHYVLIFLAIFSIAFAQNANGRYTIVAPGTIHTNSKYNVAVALHQTTEPATLRIGLMGPQFDTAKTVELQPHEVKRIVFDIPVLSNGGGDFNITAEGLAGIKFKNSTKLNHNVFQTHIKIQTDKGKYKPGDFVNFRVLFLDENLKPSVPHRESLIWIEDGKRNRLKEYRNFTVTKGVYTGKFKISDYPVLGKWQLGVVNSNGRKAIVSFDVEKYVLPKYEVSVDATSQVSVKNGDMQVVVRANYTYGKPVNAKVTLIVGMDTFYYFNNNDQTKTTPPQIIRTTNMINGKAKFDFSVSQYKENFLDFRTAPIDIVATVEENYTGVKINGTTSATLHKDRYIIRCTNYVECYSFKADEEAEMAYRVIHVDGAEVKDVGDTPVRLRFTETVEKLYYKDEQLPEPKLERKVVEFESKLNKNSTAVFKVKLPNLEEFKGYAHFFRVQVFFKDEIHNLSSAYQKRPSKPKDESKLEKLIESKTYFKAEVEYPKGRYNFNADEQIIVAVNSSSSLSYFDYNIIGRGNILVSERVFVPNKAKTYDLTLMPDFMWMPYARFYAYYIDDAGDFQYAETIFQIKVELPNKLNITAPARVEPGADVALHIETAPHSFVGLLAIDQSVLLLGNNNDINTNDFYWRLSSYTTYAPWQGGYSRYPGGQSGVVTMTNANYFYNYTPPHESLDNRFDDLTALRAPAGAVSSQAVRPVAAGGAVVMQSVDKAVRSDFSETWLFVDIEDTQTPNFTWTQKLPDTITSWVISGFALHEEQGLGVSTHTTDIVTFKPFFITITLPYSVKRGEVINIPALIFNYLDKDLDVTVTLDNTNDEYEFTEISNEIISETQRSKTVRVQAQSSAGVSFVLRPKAIGNLMLKYTARSALAGDSVHKMLKVVPEGVTEYMNRVFLVNLRGEVGGAQEFRQHFDLVIPAEIVRDSAHIEVAVIGDLLGPVLYNLDSLLRMPTGCAEQTMSTLMPNYLVLKYLKDIKKLTPAVETKILEHLETGYQHMLGFLLDDGSFGTFRNEERRGNGSTWLTAYVARSFQQLKQYIKVDDALLTMCLQYLVKRQAENGSFVEESRPVFGIERQKGVSLTAEVLLALLENKQLATPYQANIDKALAYISENLDKTENTYAKAIAVYALQRAQHPLAAKQLDILAAAATSDEDRKWWSVTVDSDRPREWWHRQANGDVEITSYVLLALLDQRADENLDDLLPIIKWLIAQRNSNGGFASTQDTVLGLQALFEYAERAQYVPAVMDIQVLAKGMLERLETINITEDNGLLLQSVELPPNTLSVDVNAKGKGTALLQIAYQYNVVEKELQPSFKIQTTIRKDTPLLKLEMEVCTEYNGKGIASNMALVEVTLPSGYVADTDSFKRIEALPHVPQLESQKSDTLIVIYFDQLPKAEAQCLTVAAVRQYAVARQKPTPIVVYDYYDTLQRATVYYEVASKMCDICEEDEQCKKACQ